MPGFMTRLKQSIDVLTNRVEPTDREYFLVSSNAGITNRVYRTPADAVLAPILTRISADCANVPMRHVTIDQDGFYKETRVGELNSRLTVSANIDQTGVAFIQDVVATVLEDGVCAIVPVETSESPNQTSSYDILQLRTGVVKQWFNRSVQLEVYNENIGDRTLITLPKSFVALAYNPFYRIMNEPNSTLKRLQDKLSLLDVSDNKTNSPNLDIILQLPYSVKNSKRQDEANTRRALLEEQLYNSRYGLAYIDATEKITQLNRPVSNTLVDQVQYLTESLYSQLGLTPKVFSGEASPEELLVYYNRTVLPILNAIAQSMRKSFLTTTAITQGQDVMVFPEIFKMAPIDKLAEAADKFTRNEIMTSNEFRGIMGLRPKSNPEADALRNKNLNKSDNEAQPDVKTESEPPDKEEITKE